MRRSVTKNHFSVFNLKPGAHNGHTGSHGIRATTK
jgi:hypothetical protein